VIDASGKLVLPGSIDAHAPRHAVRRLTSADDFESGTVAAFGGTTSIVDFAISKG
jgi:dihydroorotase-like cyclic amidohydrolase